MQSMYHVICPMCEKQIGGRPWGYWKYHGGVGAIHNQCAEISDLKKA